MGGGDAAYSVKNDPGTNTHNHTLAICCFCSVAPGGLYTIWNLLVVKQVKEDEGGG